MKTWPYGDRHLTAYELLDLPECCVTEVELRINLSKKKLSVEEALVTKAKYKRRKNSQLHRMHGLDLTPHEISDLDECEVSYWKLMQNLRNGHPIEEAIKKSPKPIIKRKVKKCIKTRFTSRLKALGSPYNQANKGQIKILNQQRCHYPIEESWEYMAAKKLSLVLEKVINEKIKEKQLNNEDLNR